MKKKMKKAVLLALFLTAAVLAVLQIKIEPADSGTGAHSPVRVSRVKDTEKISWDDRKEKGNDSGRISEDAGEKKKSRGQKENLAKKNAEDSEQTVRDASGDVQGNLPENASSDDGTSSGSGSPSSDSGGTPSDSGGQSSDSGGTPSGSGGQSSDSGGTPSGSGSQSSDSGGTPSGSDSQSSDSGGILSGSGSSSEDSRDGNSPDTKNNDTETETAGEHSQTASGDNSGNAASGSDTEDLVNCTIEIVCTALSKDLSKLTNPAVKDYIPSDGIILAKTSLSIPQGESVYYALRTAARNAGIQMDAEYSVLYSGNYVKGIQYLYEYDAGNESGWMYQVNGANPGYGCSGYTVKEGDEIVWMYTCDLGRDIGS